MRHRHRRWPVGVALLAALAAAVDAVRYAPYLIDDTFISLRYARNWVDGHGLVYNVGERVEGYTNFLFVAVAAAAMRLGIDPLWATKALSLGAALATLALVAWMGRWGTERSAGVAAVPLLLSLQAFGYWAVASFETMLFTALLTAAIACLMREHAAGRGHWSAVLFIALALTRPEGALLFVVANTAFLVVEIPARAATSGRPDTSSVLRAAINLAVFAVGFGVYTAWRRSYYGQWLPNTFYAKVTGDAAQLATGVRQLGEWALQYPLPAATLLLPLALFSPRGRAALRGAPQVVALGLINASYAIYVVLVGGDFMPFYRFYVPLLPLQCLLLAWLVVRLGGRRARAVFPAALLINLVASHLGEQPYRAFVAHRTAVVGERVGAWLRGRLAPDDLIAVNTAGAVPYASGLPAIDMLGLTDAAIARRPVYVVSTGWAGHRRGWGAYVLGRRPRVVLWYNSAGLREPFYLSDRELADNPYFRFFYRAQRAELPAVRPAPPPLARFFGAPFGGAADGHAASRDLGLVAEVVDSPLPHTVLRDGPIEVNSFELDRRDDALWALVDPREATPDAFVARAADAWAKLPPPPAADPAAAAAIGALQEAARGAAEAGDYARARALLDDALRRNAAAHSPLVYQYAANLGVLTGDLFAAVAAQKEALRLVPESALYRRNLAKLLSQPYAAATHGTGRP